MDTTRGEETSSPGKHQPSQANIEVIQQQQNHDYILFTPYPVEPGHTLITIARIAASDWRPELKSSAAHVAGGDNAGIIINKPASIMDYNRIQASQKERQVPPNAKMSFKVFLVNSGTSKISLEHRTLRFWLDSSPIFPNKKRPSVGINNNNGNNEQYDHESFQEVRESHFANLKQQSSQLAQAYFRQLLGSKSSDEFPKSYVNFIMKLMRLLKEQQFLKIVKMEVELRQLPHDNQLVSQSKSFSPEGSQCGDNIGTSGSLDSGRGSPLTSQRVLDIIESSYPNPVSVKEICSATQTDEPAVRQLVEELASKEKINSTDDGQHFTRTTKPIDTKINMVKSSQMPKVHGSQPVIAIITAQYCEKMAVDSMISDKETFVRYLGQDSGPATTSSANANYVYTLGNIGDHRVVSTKLTSVGHSRGALIAAGNATTRLLGTFPDIEYVFLVGCAGGVANYTDFSSHVRLGDIVVSHLPQTAQNEVSSNGEPTGCSKSHNSSSVSSADHIYVHCRPKLQQDAQRNSSDRAKANIPVSYSVHKNLKKAANNSFELQVSDNNGVKPKQTDLDDTDLAPTTLTADTSTADAATIQKPVALAYEDCHFRLWRPTKLNLQVLAQQLWQQGLENAKSRIWDYYIDEGIKFLKQLDIDVQKPSSETDKLFMSIGNNDTIEVSHPEATEDEIDLRREGRPMCHFGPIGSGRPAASNEAIRQRMISEFGLCAFDSEFDPVVESIYGNRKESYIMIRGISDYKDGHKKRDWQQYSALVAAAFMKSIIVNLKPLS